MINILFSPEIVFYQFFLTHVKSSGKKTFRFSAGKIWNALPVSLRSAEDLLRLRKESISISERS